jgi:hypothetical protein
MTPRDLYGLTARIGGLVFWVFSAFAIVHALTLRFNLPLPSNYSASTDALVAAIWFVLGLAMTLGAEALTRLAYGRSSTIKPASPDVRGD